MKNLFKLFVLYTVGYFQVQICSVLDRALSQGDIIEFAIINLLIIAIFLWKLPEKYLLAVCLVLFLKVCGVGLMTQMKFIVAFVLLVIVLVLGFLVVVSWESAKLVKEYDLYYEMGYYPQYYQ